LTLLNFVFKMDENSWPFVSSDAVAKFLSTKRGQPQLVDPFNYHYNKESQKKVTEPTKEYWYCPRRRSTVDPFCPGKALTIGNTIKWTKPHNHSANPIEIKVKAAKEKVLQKARDNPTLQTAQLMAEWCQETSKPEERSKAGSLKTMERSLQREKAKVREHPPVPKTFDDFANIPEHFRTTFDGQKFLISNVRLDNGERILIFSSFFGLDLLRKSENWMVDGTFSIAPEPFKQVYSILAEADNKAYAAVFSFLPNKRSGTYKCLFEEVHHHLTVSSLIQLELRHLLVDFESAVIKEFRSVFGRQVGVTGCLFHFKKNLRSHMCALPHLQSYHCRDASFHAFMDSLSALAFVPVDLVHVYYRDLIDIELPRVLEVLDGNKEVSDEVKDGIRESLNSFLDYFEKTYVGAQSRTGWSNPRFSPDIWNQHDNLMSGQQQTTNRIENYHSVLRKLIQVNGSFWDVVDKLIGYEAKVRVKRDEDREKPHDGPGPSSAREKRRSHNLGTMQSIARHRSEFSRVDYLKRISSLDADGI